MKIKSIILTAIMMFLVSYTLYSQKGYQDAELPIVKLRIDSLQKRITSLQISLNKNKSDLAKYHRIKDELVLTNFRLTYEQHYVNETLDDAKVLVDKKISESYKNNRQDLVKIYKDYDADISRRIKNQRLKYQTLFQKEKMFKIYIQPYFENATTESLNQAVFICNLALHYSQEQRVTTAQKFITKYRNLGEAKIYDLESSNNLSILTKSEGQFNKVFKPLIEVDSISKLEKAKKLAEECRYYSEKSSSKLTVDYFAYQIKVVNSKLLEKEQELSILGKSGGNLVAKHVQPMDAVNDFGIYKFYDKIVVIGKFNPAKEGMDAINANDIRVMKGMAIINADNILTKYVNKNVKPIKPNSKVIYTYFIPYLIDGKYQWFIQANKKGEQQYRIAYTFIHSEKLTEELLREYLQPISFSEEDNQKVSEK